MAKVKTKFFCKECGYESSGWLGKCPSCGSWNSFVEAKIEEPSRKRGSWVQPEENADSGSNKVQQLSQIISGDEERFSSGMPELNRVLGGGLVRGSLILLGGDPGIGKSTLLLQVSAAVAGEGRKILYVSGEESPGQIRLRANRLKLANAAIALLPSTSFTKIEEAIRQTEADFVVIDSIQTIYVPEIASAPGTVTQVREAAGGLLRLAKNLNTTIVLVGHVTKDGSIAGPRILEHMVDTVLYFEGEGQSNLRLLRCVKNRFGTTDELAVFEMRDQGLFSISDPSLFMLKGRPIDVPGLAVTSCLEGSRPLLLEIQALLTPSSYQQALRMSQGIDRLRLSLLLAVLQKALKRDFSALDCYLNVTGGIRIRETAADLAVLAAILSSSEDKSLPADLLIIGEVGLSGEIRPVSRTSRRVQEALRLGWKKFILPSQSEEELSKLALPDGCQLYYVSLVNEAVDLFFVK